MWSILIDARCLKWHCSFGPLEKRKLKEKQSSLASYVEVRTRLLLVDIIIESESSFSRFSRRRLDAPYLSKLWPSHQHEALKLVISLVAAVTVPQGGKAQWLS